MTDKLRIYKILDEIPSIYVEIEDQLKPFDLALYLGATLVDTVINKKAYHIFNVTESGEYSVVVKYHDGSSQRSNSLSFFKTEFSSNKSLKKSVTSKEINAIDFSAKEPEIGNVDEVYIEIKVSKDKSETIQNTLDTFVGENKFHKRKTNLDSFPKTHSIHNYEYYKTSSILSKEKAQEIVKKLELIQDNLVYYSIVPVNLPIQKQEMTNKRQASLKAKKNSEKTPDFSAMQGYLDAPHGMNIRKVWEKGYTGELAVVRHMDFGIYKGHEDFQEGNITVVTSRSEEKYNCNHGTASTGCVAAGKNGFGITGIAYSAAFYFYDTGDRNKVLEDIKPGDIVSINIQDANYSPMLAGKDWWDAAKNMIEKGAIVIMAAGNGSHDLSDKSICPDYGDCGAMLVGACSSSTGRKLGLSNYGHYASVINSWGENVVTTGSDYDDLQNLKGHNRDYNKGYSGTSSATPLCAGALALLQGYAKKHNAILTAKTMKELLAKSDYVEGVNGRIGKRPNVLQLCTLIDELINEPMVG